MRRQKRARSGLPYLLLAALSMPLAAQETGKVLDLRYKVLDLLGVEKGVAGRIEAMQIRETATEIRIELAADVLFDFDKADIKPEAEEVLGRAAGLIRERGSGSVRIEGHTDSKGDDAYNQRLSERRASSVRNWLTSKGEVRGVRFETSGAGETRPIAPNEKPDGSDDPDGRQKNRRVEIVMKKG